LFELDEEFVASPAAEVSPASTVHHLGANRAAEVLDPGVVGTVMSGLPLLSMPVPRCAKAIVARPSHILAPRWPAMCSSPMARRPPLPAETIRALGLRVEPVHKVWANLPPARVYRFYRA
jgi:phosphatidylethanolamine/phosphatidyl-N-methylethanolamine N-methyltransferase